MIIRLPEKEVKVFTISPRTTDEKLYLENIENVTQWSEQYDCTGVLIFTGNDTYIDPWLIAQRVLCQTRQVSPLIAVNPIYMHPFTAAKSRYASVTAQVDVQENYTVRKNFTLKAGQITVTPTSALAQAGYAADELIAGQGLTSFNGEFYKVTNSQLLPRIPRRLQPRYLLAGQSDAAHQVASALGAVTMRMLPPDLESDLKGATGIHFGITTRSGEKDAWEAAFSMFPEDSMGQQILGSSMQNTDSVWKRKMYLTPEDESLKARGYWLGPFRNFKADCPYLVGDYHKTANVIASLIDNDEIRCVDPQAGKDPRFFKLRPPGNFLVAAAC